MGCSSSRCKGKYEDNNSSENIIEHFNKTDFINACQEMKKTNRCLNALKVEKENCYIILTKSIPNLINLVKKYNIFDNDFDLDEYFKNQRLSYNKDKNIELIYQNNQIKEILNNYNENEFIIVEKNFLEKFEIEKYENKDVKVIIDNDKHIGKIIFHDFEIDFSVIKNGFYKFHNFNLAEGGTIIIPKYIKKPRVEKNVSRQNSLNYTLYCLIKNNIIQKTYENRIIVNENSELSNKIKNLISTKVLPSSFSEEEFITILSQI